MIDGGEFHCKTECQTKTEVDGERDRTNVEPYLSIACRVSYQAVGLFCYCECSVTKMHRIG